LRCIEHGTGEDRAHQGPHARRPTCIRMIQSQYMPELVHGDLTKDIGIAEHESVRSKGNVGVHQLTAVVPDAAGDRQRIAEITEIAGLIGDRQRRDAVAYACAAAAGSEAKTGNAQIPAAPGLADEAAIRVRQRIHTDRDAGRTPEQVPIVARARVVMHAQQLVAARRARADQQQRRGHKEPELHCAVPLRTVNCWRTWSTNVSSGTAAALPGAPSRKAPRGPADGSTPTTVGPSAPSSTRSAPWSNPTTGLTKRPARAK